MSRSGVSDPGTVLGKEPGILSELASGARFFPWAPAATLSGVAMLVNFFTSALSGGVYLVQYLLCASGAYLSWRPFRKLAAFVASPFPWEMWFFNTSKNQPHKAPGDLRGSNYHAAMQGVRINRGLNVGAMFVPSMMSAAESEKMALSAEAEPGSRVETFLLSMFGSVIGLCLVTLGFAVLIVRLPLSVLNLGWTMARLGVDHAALWVGTERMDARTFWATYVFGWEGSIYQDWVRFPE